jgi:hypothetical protein
VYPPHGIIDTVSAIRRTHAHTADTRSAESADTDAVNDDPFTDAPGNGGINGSGNDRDSVLTKKLTVRHQH